MKNCAIGGCEHRAASTCPSCVHWSPSRESKYYRCARFLGQRLLCWLSADACGTCNYYLPPGVAGAPKNETGVDWSSPEQVAEYARLKRLPIVQLKAGFTCYVNSCTSVVKHIATSAEVLIEADDKIPLCRAHYSMYVLAKKRRDNDRHAGTPRSD